MTWRMLAASAAILAAASGASAQEIRVNADQATRVKLDSPARTVIIGNALIAEATMVDDHTIYVLGRMVGQTNVVAVDKAGNEVFNQLVQVGVGDQQMVTLLKGAGGPRTLSCSPRCEWILAPGDENFKTLQEDADKKQQQSDAAAQLAGKSR